MIASVLSSSPTLGSAAWKLFALALLDQTGRYLVLAGGLALLIALARRGLAHRRLQPRPPRSGQVRREIRQAIGACAIFASVHVPVLLAVVSGHGGVYRDVEEWGNAYLVGSALGVLVAHDTYFYWTHRLLHHGWWFRRIHRVHHRSTVPTPWGGFAMHPVEAVIHAGIYPLLAFGVPLHTSVVSALPLFITFYAAWAHCGYDLFPRFACGLGAVLNGTRQHDDHHRFGRYYYTLYFRFWDQVMGTEPRPADARLAPDRSPDLDEKGTPDEVFAA